MIHQLRLFSLLLGTVGLAAASRFTIAASSSTHSTSAMSMSSPAKVNSTKPKAIIGSVQGRALVRALRHGGLILWMRHGTRDNRSGAVSDQQAAEHNCAQQSRLTATGKKQVRSVGAGMRALHLPITAVYTARLCRTEATARLLNVGPVTVTARLDEVTTWSDRGGSAAYQKAVLAMLSKQPPAGRNIVEVTSKLMIPHPRPAVLAHLQPAEIAVFRPRPGSSPKLLARIRHGAWSKLSQVKSARASSTH